MKKVLLKKIIVLSILALLIPCAIFAQVAGEGKNASAMSTKSATNVTATTATLNGAISSNDSFPVGTNASVYFRYSSKTNFPPVFCNDIFGSEMRSTNEVKLTSLQNQGAIIFSTDISDLEPDTEYFFCAVGSNQNVIQYGEVKSFITNLSSLENMSVMTKSPTVVNTKSVYLNGFYNTGVQAETWFEYRTKSNQANFLNKQQNTGKNTANYEWSGKKGEKTHNAMTNGNISFLLSGLSPNTTYQYRTAINKTDGGNTIYGEIFDFKTNTTSTSSIDYNYSSDSGTNNNTNLTLGQNATPPADAVVRYHEGIETVLIRQIINNTQIAKTFGYKEGTNLQTFAWGLADLFARIFGYVDENGREIRVSPPDVAAYALQLKSGDLTVYEYFAGVIINIQKMTEVLRGTYGYEYYFKK